MSTNDALSPPFGNGAVASAAAARDATAERKPATREWWRFAARPFVLASGFVLLAAISAVSIFFVVTTQSNSDLVAHTLQVENQLSGLRALLRNAESGARGYLLTQQPEYFKDYKAASEAIAPAFATLKETTADNPVQQQSLAELGPIIERRLNALHGGIRTFDAGNAAAVIADIRTGRGRASMLEIRAIISRMTDEEHGLLKLRTASATRSNILLLGINLAGVALMIALAVVSILTVRRIGAEALRDSEKRGNELQAAVKELDAFSYSVSHDLRSPLRAIDGFSRILLKNHAAALGPEPREYLQAVRDNTVQMSQLVDDLLEFARLNRKSLSQQPVAPAKIVEQVLRDAQRDAADRVVNVSVGELPPVTGDPALLKQVFVNLIGNAFKYTRPRAEAKIEIGAREIDGEQVFYVRDNGVGFDMQYANQLFSVFQRLHRAEDFEGTGVGLAIVHRIIQRHGGRIWADAAVDKGATFYFTTESPDHA